MVAVEAGIVGLLVGLAEGSFDRDGRSDTYGHGMLGRGGDKGSMVDSRGQESQDNRSGTMGGAHMMPGDADGWGWNGNEYDGPK